jgi:hypothetical protein
MSGGAQRGPATLVAVLPLLLAILGIAIPFAGNGFVLWQLALLWSLVVFAVGVAIRRLRPSPQMRVFIGIAALVVLFLLAWEGGWWLLPAVLAQIVLDARAADTAAPHALEGS